MTSNLICYQTFKGVCTFVAIVLTSWCLYEYQLDNDISDISLRKFHDTPDDIHPSITLCHKDPFQYYEKSLTTSDEVKQQNEILLRYISLIVGDERIKKKNVSIQELNNMDYDNLTVRLEDIIQEVVISYPVTLDDIYRTSFNARGNILTVNKNESVKPKAIDWKEFKTFDHVDTYVSARHGKYKCFTFDVPVIKGLDIRTIRIRFQERPNVIDLGLFHILLTYPNQTLQVSRGNQIPLNQYIQYKRPSCYKFEVFVGTMEVFRRRNKLKKRCNEDWKHQDQKQLNDIANEVGCNPRHWNHASQLPNCSSVEEYKEINRKLFRKDGFVPPCRSIEGLSKITKGTDLGWRCIQKYLELIFYLDEERFYKEISLVRAYTFTSLIGNAGKLVKLSDLY